MTKLTDQEVNFLRLIMRSNDVGDGWREVSTPVWTLVEMFKRKELLDVEPDPQGGGRIRLNERGKVVADYV